jgi:hypothetical protein
MGIMRVDDVGPAVFVSGEVKLHDAIGRDGADVIFGIPAMISRTNVDVVSGSDQNWTVIFRSKLE